MRTQGFSVAGSWPGDLTLSPRPRGGDWLEEELDSWSRSGVRTVVSLLTDDEVIELGLEVEAALLQKRGIRFLRLPIPDRGLPPSVDEFANLLRELRTALNATESVRVHCRQGIGRAGLIAIGLLLATGHPVEDAIQHVSNVRGTNVPETHEQRRWIEDFARSQTRLAA